MAIVLEFSNQGTPFNGDPSPFPCFGNVSPPYMAMLYLPRFMVGLLVWLFSNSLIPNTQASPPQQHQPHADPLTSFPIMSSSFSSSSLGENLNVSNQEAKKKKKRKKKKKKNKKGGNQATISMSVDNVEEPSNIHRKIKFPYKLCKDDHLLIDCPGIPKFLEAWSEDYPQLTIVP